ncbi:hypothetical protein H4219_001754 [Mycoemilia scoparia]|uniref:Major facilitator superfamily (MFS) profile domain-containing protein n=1 Tax=Mycoemilia scoparia TaxID=417184 RepID=A0A9W8DQ16_9FUNG|nr:hypothetical protein H4219_001754 [Mycoemilia scoparia]
MVCAVASLGGLLFGYDQGNMSEILQMPPFLEYFNYPNATHQGLMTSMLTLGCFLGALCSAYLADRLSRKYAIMVGCAVFIIGSALQTGAVNEAMMIVSRIIGGIGVGILSNIVPLFQSELAPPEIRGRLICLQQIAITGGIMVAFWIGYGCSKIKTTASFRIPLGVQIIPALVLMAAIMFMPFSPRWLIAKGRDEEACAVLAKLRAGGDLDHPMVIREFNEIKEVVTSEKEVESGSYLELVKHPVRRRVIIGIVVQAFLQLTGINTIMYYAPKIFKQAGLKGTDAPLLAQGINGVLNFLCTIPITVYIDKWGRRSTLMFGALGMVVAYIAMGTIMAVYGKPFQDGSDTSIAYDNGAASRATMAFVYIFVACYALSWGPICWIYPSEIFPMRVRAKATSITTATNWIFNFLVAQVAPILMSDITWGLYIIFACFNLLAFMHVFFFCPETKGVMLEDMDELFGQSVWAFKVKSQNVSHRADNDSSEKQTFE